MHKSIEIFNNDLSEFTIKLDKTTIEKIEKNRQEIIKKFNLSESANSNETLPLFVNVEGDSVVFSLFDFSELNEGQESEGLDQW